MKQSKDPFEAAAYEEQEESPPHSPIAGDEFKVLTPAPPSSQKDVAVSQDDDDDDYDDLDSAFVNHPSTSSTPMLASAPITKAKNKEDEDEEEEDNMDIELSKLPSSADPDKMAKMQ